MTELDVIYTVAPDLLDDADNVYLTSETRAGGSDAVNAVFVLHQCFPAQFCACDIMKRVLSLRLRAARSKTRNGFVRVTF